MFWGWAKIDFRVSDMLYLGDYMGKSNKLQMWLLRLRRPKDFAFNELETLLKGFGFELSNAGGTSGSAVMKTVTSSGFINRAHNPP